MLNYFFIVAWISELARWAILHSDAYLEHSVWKSISLTILFTGWVFAGNNIIN